MGKGLVEGIMGWGELKIGWSRMMRDRESGI